MTRLARFEIDLLKHLARYSPTGIPIVVPPRFQPAFAALWRIGLIEIWYRQSRDAAGSRRTQFVSITADGTRRIETILAHEPREQPRD